MGHHYYPGKAVDDGTNIQAPANVMGDLSGVPGHWHQHSPAQTSVDILGKPAY